ncbi:hypothetical protein ACFO9Q_22690 [Paenibacillus sp. GCM10023252]|uniref:hypothetical protein n=1 Tax=Paenibacillus sp. GCM10023252 TaxID=3252649 RepID=UPI0036215635
MAKRLKPPYYGIKGKGKVISATRKASALQVGPTFSRLTVLWVGSNGVPFDTSGFFARLFRGNSIVQTASFDGFGVVRFSRVSTLTTVSYTIRLYNENGVQFRVRTIPAGVQTYAVIG